MTQTTATENHKRAVKTAENAILKIENALINLEIDHSTEASELLITAIRKGIDGNLNFSPEKTIDYFKANLKNA